MADTNQPHEIIIVRRRRDSDHDEPHGGVWKVAFADFMTAMMAFFLVLWIVNSTSKETRASVARYFNPVRLSDTTPARKGLQEAREEDFDASVKMAESKKQPTPAHADDAKPSVDKESTQAIAPAAAVPDRPRTPPPSSPASAVFRDPFEITNPKLEAAARMTAVAQPSALPAVEKTGIADDRLRQSLVSLASDLQGKHGPAVSLRETAEGLLVSLTDQADYGMFTLGSTEPNAALVKLIADLGSVLKSSKNAIVVRGYTDGRRYRKAGFDNWRLSTGRAQIVCDMLLRGGVEEPRIDRVEGYADHNLRNPQNPEAAENRRVEILVRKETRP